MEAEDFLKICEGTKDQNRVSINELFHGYTKKRIDDYNQEVSLDGYNKRLKELGLALIDGYFIMAYTGSVSGWLNTDKRDGKNYYCTCKKTFADGLELGLLKLPPFHGKVYRMERCDNEGVQATWFKNNIGTKICLPYFLSTAKNDYNNAPMVWIIKTLPDGKGRDISEISNSTHENEILFNRGAKFVICDVDNSNADKTVVFMEEIPDQSDVDIDLCGVYYR